TVAISTNAVHPDPAQRSIRNPSSVVALSVQVRLIWLVETAAAASAVGAAGGAGAGPVAKPPPAQSSIAPLVPSCPIPADPVAIWVSCTLQQHAVSIHPEI